METKQQDQAYQQAQVLISEAEAQGFLSDLFEEIRQVLTVFDQQNLERFFRNKTIDVGAKANILSLLQKEVSPLLASFFEQTILASSYDLVYASLAEIVHHSQAEMGQYDIKITTAVPLSASQKLRLVERAEELFDLQARQIFEELAPEIMGGFIIEANHKVIDASVRQQLEQFKSEMR